MFKRSRRLAAFEKGLPEALDLMVSGLRAGHSLLAAIALVSKECQEPVKSEFKICFEEQNYGLELKAALENLLIRVPLQDMKITAAAILIQKESGGNLAEVLDKTSAVIRDRFRLRRQIRVYTAQGRLTGWILTLLPVVLGVVIYFIDPDLISILWHRDIGIKLLWAAAGIDPAGRLCDQPDCRHRRVGERDDICGFGIFGGVSADWQRRVSAVLPRSHAQAHQRGHQPAAQRETPDFGQCRRRSPRSGA